MAGLRISDSKPISADCLILCRKKDKMPNGTVKELNILRECIRPGTKLEFDDDERNVNTDEVIGNIFGRPKVLECRG